MVALLKQKSKIQIQQKPRVKYEIKNIFKRQKVDSNLGQSQMDQLNQFFGKQEIVDGKKKITPLHENV